MTTLRLLTLFSSLVAQVSVGEAGTVSPVTSGLPRTWKYAACYVDNANNIRTTSTSDTKQKSERGHETGHLGVLHKIQMC